jgi:hypothetical protein
VRRGRCRRSSSVGCRGWRSARRRGVGQSWWWCCSTRACAWRSSLRRRRCQGCRRARARRPGFCPEPARGVCAVAVRLLLTGDAQAQPAVSSLAGTWGAARLSAPCRLLRSESQPAEQSEAGAGLLSSRAVEPRAVQTVRGTTATIGVRASRTSWALLSSIAGPPSRPWDLDAKADPRDSRRGGAEHLRRHSIRPFHRARQLPDGKPELRGEPPTCFPHRWQRCLCFRERPGAHHTI